VYLKTALHASIAIRFTNFHFAYVAVNWVCGWQLYGRCRFLQNRIEKSFNSSY